MFPLKHIFEAKYRDPHLKDNNDDTLNNPLKIFHYNLFSVLNTRVILDYDNQRCQPLRNILNSILN